MLPDEPSRANYNTRMARPRVFVSSTFYDLKQLRAELERFIHSLGYDPVLNERGLVPYGGVLLPRNHNR